MQSVNSIQGSSGGNGVRSQGQASRLDCVLFSLLVASVFLNAGSAAAEPRQPSAEMDRAVSDVLRTASNRAELSTLLGTGIDRCLETTTTQIQCAWELRNRHDAWSELAQILGTRKRVIVVCDLPADASARAFDSCAARPRASNRSMWNTIPKSGPGSRKGARGGKPDKGASRFEYAAKAKSWLANARTLSDLTRLMGAIPESCDGGLGMNGAQICVWKTTNRTYGHGTIAASEQAPLNKKMILRCVVPMDGSSRESGSCQARVGG